MPRSERRLLVWLACALAVGGCLGGSETGPRICDDPSGTYHGVRHWTAGNCAVTDGSFTFTLAHDGAAWTMTADWAWGGVTATVTPSDGASCGLDVELLTTDIASEAETDTFALTQDDSGHLQGAGTVQVVGSAGSCAQDFELVDLEWMP